MRRMMGFAAAAALFLGFSAAANAQGGNFGGFGGYPAGITSGSQYGFYPGGYGTVYAPARAPAPYVRTPGSTYYSSGYYGGLPGGTAYGPGVNFSSPNAAAYGYTAPVNGRYGAAPYYPTAYGYAPAYRATTTYYGPAYGTTTTYRVRRGLFGPRAVVRQNVYR